MPSTTDPKDWFLDEVSFTKGNIATPLIDGEIYFKELNNILTSNPSFLNILISGWRLNMNTMNENRICYLFTAALTFKARLEKTFQCVWGTSDEKH